MGVEELWHRWLRVPYTMHVYRRYTTPDARATLVFLHGLGNSGQTWEQVVEGLPDDVNILIVDLLGFGDSPAPAWALYDAKTQARALAKTLVLEGIFRDVILVGHSMGSLVAIEFAKRYPIGIRSLVLCSPPLYKKTLSDKKLAWIERDELLKRTFELAAKYPSNIKRLAEISKRAKLKSPYFDPSKLNVDTYIAALRSSIINQTALDDIVRLSQPIHILYGTLDPVVIGRNIRLVEKTGKHVTVKRFIGPHEVIGKYVTRLTRELNAIVGKGK